MLHTVVLVLGIGVARGQYYWILGALFGIVLTLFMFEIVAFMFQDSRMLLMQVS